MARGAPRSARKQPPLRSRALAPAQALASTCVNKPRIFIRQELWRKIFYIKLGEQSSPVKILGGN